MPVLSNFEAIRSVLPEGLPLSWVVVVATVLVGVVYSILAQERPFPGFPLASLEGKSPKKSWLFHGSELVQDAVQKYSGAFQIMSGTGPKLILPNRYADEIRNHPSMSFGKAFQKEFFTEYHGFEPFKQGLEDDTLIQETVRVKLTQSLGLVTEDLIDETTSSLHDILGDDAEWKQVFFKDAVLDIVARLSSRVFLGKDMCRDKRWLEIAKRYTIESFVGSFIMRMAPSLLRPIVYWFIPQCRFCRGAIRDAHKIIDPEVERRVAAVDAALRAGQKPKKTADAIGWIYEVSRGRPVNYVNAQMSLTLAAIHTTSETASQAILDICEHPEVVQPLREEIIQVISEHGWAKTSLYKLKLMDSFLKESQRCSPLSSVSMNRYVESEVVLSDGTVLPKGSRIAVAANFMDPRIYPEPEKFDASRFLKMRAQPGNENNWQFVTVNADHMLFGHGQHACPGRFFASNEIKIALCHLLLKYDWRLVPGAAMLEPQCFETSRGVNPKIQLDVRRRKEEIELDLPEYKRRVVE